MTERHQQLAWAGLTASAAALEWWTLQDTGRVPFSQLTRRTFRTHTNIGRWAFGVTWLGFASWYCWHVLKPRRPHLRIVR